MYCMPWEMAIGRGKSLRIGKKPCSLLDHSENGHEESIVLANGPRMGKEGTNVRPNSPVLLSTPTYSSLPIRPTRLSPVLPLPEPRLTGLVVPSTFPISSSTDQLSVICKATPSNIKMQKHLAGILVEGMPERQLQSSRPTAPQRQKEKRERKNSKSGMQVTWTAFFLPTGYR
ncbi:hypothetical protein BR93DRAFT_88951 [Coniochaeta sp. PMI_546]|nr:hypothetical protein BR93DRAFT_88951 [Coniochaeta sp. PMI_546]